MSRGPLHIVLRCAGSLLPKVRYVFDSVFMATGIPVAYSRYPPSTGPWILYGPAKNSSWPLDRCVTVAHCPGSWRLFEGDTDVAVAVDVDGLTTVLPERVTILGASLAIPVDIVANAFYFLSCWSERVGQQGTETRRMHASSVFVRLDVPQDIVDQYLQRLLELLASLYERLGLRPWPVLEWPQRSVYGLVLSHDIDFIPSGFVDTAKQGAKTVLRHFLSHRDAADAALAAVELVRALARGRDPYGCVPEIIAREKELGVRASFQVAVGHRHANDVNYRIEDDRVRDYLCAIIDSGFDLCLHGSYRSTEKLAWYVEEVELLSRRLGRPLGSRQHFLSFEYDTLFSAQERAGIQYDMSMGFPDRPGPRAGFSYPYFPYCLREDRPYDVLQISLFLMDVTLRSYLGLKGSRAWHAIAAVLDDLRQKRGCASLVWHPIVFGGARDPGYDRLFWDTVNYVHETGGVATDGRTINAFWRGKASNYASFSRAPSGMIAPGS